MRIQKHIIRIIITVIFGVFLTYKNMMFKYENFIFDFIIFLILLILAIILWGWIAYKDYIVFKRLKQKKYLTTLFIGFIFILANLLLNYKINSDFNKPTLLKVFYDGDYNGTGIDFKTDGTYIFDNSAIGYSSYKYGKYQISENKIKLDKITLENVINTNILKIKTLDIEYSDTIRKEDYLVQIDENGCTLEDETKFRIVIDNREYKP